MEVIGTDEPLGTEAEATAYANWHRADRSAGGSFVVPIVLLVFSMEGDKGYFGWILEPRVGTSGEPTLAPATVLKFTKTSTESIFRDSTSWFEAMFQVLLPEKKSKYLLRK